MNKILERIFKNYKQNPEKLRKYGFTESNGAFFHNTDILGGQFALYVKVANGNVETEVVDLSTNEPYTLFLADSASGSFVGAVRTSYENVLCDVAAKCFDKCVFKSDCAQQVIGYVSATYGDELEFLWEKFDDNAIWRRKDNRKWYAVMLTVAGNKLGMLSDEKVEILDLRADAEKIDNIVDGKTIFRGYHMNKKHWITVCLDGSLPQNEIEKMIDRSYELAKKG